MGAGGRGYHEAVCFVSSPRLCHGGKCKEVFGKAVQLLVELASLQVSTAYCMEKEVIHVAMCLFPLLFRHHQCGGQNHFRDFFMIFYFLFFI